MAEVKEAVVTTPEELAKCCTYLATQPLLGFDTEFVGEESYHPSLCLVQVGTPERLYLIDPLSTGPLDAFWQLLHDPNRVAVVHAGREEVRLCRQLSGQVPGNLFDIQIAAGLLGMNYPMGHGAIVNDMLKVKLSKGETLTEWRRRPLTPDQIRYAFDDVRFLIRLHEKLSARLIKLGRTEWAREEFQRLANATDPEALAEGERWRKLKGISSLDRKKLAIVRALYLWREKRAEERNRPPRTIIRDDLIGEIARRTPANARDLQVIRGLAHRDLDAIFDVIQEAKNLPQSELPELFDRVEDPPQVNLISGMLIAVLGDIALRERIAPNLVASNNDIRLVVRAHSSREPLPDIPLTRGWRAEEVLPKLQAVLAGKMQVRIGNVNANAPLTYTEHAPKEPATD